MRWHYREIIRESLRNVNPISFLMGFFVIGILFGSGFLAGMTAQNIAVQEMKLRDAGSLVWVASAYQNSENKIVPVPADKCLAAQESSIVLHAGGVGYSLESETVSYLPAGQLLPLVRVLPGSVKAWQPNISEHQIMVGDELVAQGAVRPGSLVTVDGKNILRIEKQLPSTIGTSALRSNILFLDNSLTELRECWISVDPSQIEKGQQVLSYYVGNEFPTTQFLPPDGILQSPTMQWKTFLDSHVWAYFALGMSFIVLSFTFFQRSKFAIYRIFGAKSFEVFSVLNLHTFYVLTTGYLLSVFAGSVMIIFTDVIIFSSFFVTSTLTYIAALLLSLFTGPLALVGDPLIQLRQE